MESMRDSASVFNAESEEKKKIPEITPDTQQTLLRLLPSGPDLVRVAAFRGVPGKTLLYTKFRFIGSCKTQGSSIFARIQRAFQCPLSETVRKVSNLVSGKNVERILGAVSPCSAIREAL